MKEYCTIVIKPKNSFSHSDIISFVIKNVQYNENFFSFQHMHHRFLNGRKREIYERLGLKEYEYSVTLKNTDIPMVSNLDERWDRFNGENTKSLSDEKITDLIEFTSLLGRYDFYSWFLCVDEIMWDNVPVGKGTYGFRKADSCYGLGYGYLSNCIIIGKTCHDKALTLILCCEKQYRSLDIIKNIIDKIGEIKYEDNLFAPEDAVERAQWNNEAMEANRKFKSALYNLKVGRFPNSKVSDDKVKINIQKLIKDILYTDGWIIRKADFYEHPTVICKNKEDSEISLSLISGHNGHHLQTILRYKSKKFSFSDNIHEFYVNNLDSSSANLYFEKLKSVLNYFYDVL